MDRRDDKGRWLVGSMSGRMRVTAAVLSALTLTITLVFAGLLYRVGTAPTPMGGIPTVAVQQSSPTREGTTATEAGSSEAGVETIEEDAVPLAAPGQPQQQRGLPVHLLFGFGIGFAVVFFILHIMRVNESITDMHRKTR